LDKGIKGVAANADLLVGHESLKKPVLVQVKSCISRPLKWVSFGGFPARILDGEGSLFNSKPGFHADFIAAVSIKSPMEYRVFLVPVGLAERILAKKFKEFHRVPLKDGTEKKSVPIMFVSVRSDSELNANPTQKNKFFSSVTKIVRNHENAFHLLLGEKATIGDAASLLDKEAPPATELAEVE